MVLVLYKVYNKTLFLSIVTGIFKKSNLHPHQMQLCHNIIIIETSDVSNAFKSFKTIVLIEKTEYT